MESVACSGGEAVVAEERHFTADRSARDGRGIIV